MNYFTAAGLFINVPTEIRIAFTFPHPSPADSSGIRFDNIQFNYTFDTVYVPETQTGLVVSAIALIAAFWQIRKNRLRNSQKSSA